jgi:hypothetical protein
MSQSTLSPLPPAPQCSSATDLETHPLSEQIAFWLHQTQDDQVRRALAACVKLAEKVERLEIKETA